MPRMTVETARVTDTEALDRCFIVRDVWRAYPLSFVVWCRGSRHPFSAGYAAARRARVWCVLWGVGLRLVSGVRSMSLRRHGTSST